MWYHLYGTLPRKVIIIAVFPLLFLPFVLTCRPHISLCLCILLWAAKSVMVTALLSCPTVGAGAAPGHLTPTLWRLESWGATLSSTPGHLTSPQGLDEVTTSFPSHFPDEHAALPSTVLPSPNDFLQLKPQPANLRRIVLGLNESALPVCNNKGLQH